ncbi:hypothetical protein [uncultured Roseovarius sp.]|uniref:hypothetical protein n=1 Tax=uncultured Roseovarius sp. TaxID=293344 RepID=UPI002619A500|nr:hypothetical protein [uncultured Roseovarius sp.]
MKKNATDRFFNELSLASTEITGPDSALAKAARMAADAPSPTNYVKAQEALALVQEDVREKILQKVHGQMCSNIEAIWDQLPHAAKTDRPN